MIQVKRCIDCGKRKPLWEYSRDAKSRDGLTGRCKACGAAKQATYRETHPEQIAAYNRVYRETHPEQIAAMKRAYNETPRGRAVKRAIKMRRRLSPGGQRLTAEMIEEAMEASDGTCPYCGEPFEDGHIDHIIPVSRGGTNDRENLVYCCAFCNMSKHDQKLEDWLGSTGRQGRATLATRA